jgi:hypothetical protein
MEPIYIPILLGAIFGIAIGTSYLMQIGTLSTKEWNQKMTDNIVKQQEIDEIKSNPVEVDLTTPEVEFEKVESTPPIYYPKESDLIHPQNS